MVVLWASIPSSGLQQNAKQSRLEQAVTGKTKAPQNKAKQVPETLIHRW